MADKVVVAVCHPLERILLEVGMKYVPLIVRFLARAVLLVFNGILEFMPNITIRLRLSPLIPLLKESKKARSSVPHPSQIPTTAYLMPHNTFLILRTPRIPFREITLPTLSRSGIRKVQKDGSKPTSTFNLVSAGDLA